MKRYQAFTLIELMMVVALVAILLTVGVPSFRTIMQNNRAATQANTFITALNRARSEAVRRGVPMTICGSTDQTSCSGSNSWESGWIVFADDNGAGTRGTVDGGEEIIAVSQGFDGGSSLTSTSGDNNITYLPSGFTDDTAATTFTLTIPDCYGDHGREVNVNPQGRIEVKPKSC